MSDGQILRTGVLFKKGSGTGPFGRKNWKPRYFVLTPARLQYFTFEDGELKGELSLQGCDEGVLEVMPADSMKTGSSASTIWRIAINAPERRLLVAAGTEMEMNDWVDKLVLAFRINSGQPPLQRASMPAPSSDNNSGLDGRAAAASIPSVNSNPSIRDFQNFSVPRRGLNQRHSVGADTRPSAEEQELQLQLAQAESVKQQQLEEHRRFEEEQRQEEIRHEQQLRRQEEQQHRQAEQDAEMRRQLAAQQQREQEQELERQQEEEALDAALAAAEELQRQEEQEKRAQRQQEKEMELQRAREAEEAARLQTEQEQQAIRNSRLAHELAVQEKLKPQQGEDLLELQRRQKREEHARERAEREKALKLKMQQEQEQDLAFRMTQQMNSHFSVDDESDDSDYEPEASPSSPVVESGPIGSGGLDDEGAAASAHSPTTAPRSSLVGDAKREMIQKQQQEHQRRREAALKQEQQERDAEWRQQQVEMEQQRAKMAAVNVREAPREVEVAPREIEVVRRAPVKKPAPMESFEF